MSLSCQSKGRSYELIIQNVTNLKNPLTLENPIRIFVIYFKSYAIQKLIT